MLKEKRFRVHTLLGVCLVLATSRCPAGSIFDDDYVPPQRAETPKADVPPSPVPEPAPTPTPPTTVNPHEVPATPTPTVNETRRAVPKPAEQAQCRKLFKEAFADQLKDKSPNGRRKLAGVLLTEAAKTTATPIDYFVLLSGAVQSGEEAGNLHLSFDAIDTLSKSYSFDPLAAKADAAEKVWSSVTSATATVGNVQHAFDVIDALTTDDDFITAAKVETALQHGLLKISDAELKTAAGNHLRDLQAARAERQRLTPNLDALKKSPTDPAANLAVGSFWCFAAGQWERGLPYLARGNDATIKTLAETELLHSTDAQAVAKLADGWWDASAKLPGPAHTKTQIHAAVLYRTVVAGIPGIQRLAIEKRIAATPSADWIRRVDMLEMIDLTADVIRGKWKFADGVLSCESEDYARIEFPYSPPDEYDFRISFTISKGQENLPQICYCAGHQFDWEMGLADNRACAFALIRGAAGADNQTVRRSNRWFVHGQRYTSVIKVRKTGIEALINDKPISSWKTDYSDMSLPDGWRLHDATAIGLGAYQDAVEFDVAEVVEITGQGKGIR